MRILSVDFAEQEPALVQQPVPELAASQITEESPLAATLANSAESPLRAFRYFSRRSGHSLDSVQVFEATDEVVEEEEEA